MSGAKAKLEKPAEKLSTSTDFMNVLKVCATIKHKFMNLFTSASAKSCDANMCGLFEK